MIGFIIYRQNLGSNQLIIILELPSALHRCEARRGNVELQLRLNCFEAIKLTFTTQEVFKRHTHFLAIQVTIKIEQVSLKQ